MADGYYSKISPITPETKKRMIKGNSWRYGCPVALNELRYLQVKYWNLKGTTNIGELIVHRNVAKSVSKIFGELYAIKYPIKQMRLVSDFKGSDWQSIEADNTSAFNCRNIIGNKNKWSNHAYGKAIDINPIENPYMSRKGTSSHSKSRPFLPNKRFHKSTLSPADKAVLLKNDKAVKIFKNYGWRWGGDWKGIKDYQHFDKNNKVSSEKKTKTKKIHNLF